MNKDTLIEIILGLLILIFVLCICILMITCEKTPELKTIDGEPFTKNDLFRLTVSNDPLHEDIIFEMDLTFWDMVSYGMINEDFELNQNDKYWEILAKSKASNKIKYYPIGKIQSCGYIFTPLGFSESYREWKESNLFVSIWVYI